MNPEQIEALLKQQHEIAEVSVESDGKHYHFTVVSDAFIDLPKVKRQLWVYALLNQPIISGQLHAIHMNTWTKAEWQKIQEENQRG
ncbi:MAG TPA: BolA/IbaG family iron-sulfur metabolism protein [Legionellaceae bacterium]|nr:BolA/IbaG family iron-sulfur metabolism protein [Legionellaceae bacterium]